MPTIPFLVQKTSPSARKMATCVWPILPVSSLLVVTPRCAPDVMTGSFSPAHRALLLRIARTEPLKVRAYRAPTSTSALSPAPKRVLRVL